MFGKAHPANALVAVWRWCRKNTRFALLRHMFGSPLHIVIMAAVMVAIMGVVMMMR